MPRKPRENVEGGIYHVFARGDGRDEVYRDDADRRTYLRMLEQVVTSASWHCLAFCLMTNHVHLLLETPEANLSSGMHRLHSRYARVFNDRHHRCGHVFQGRYGAVRLKSDRQLRAVLAYIARNPVEAALCERPGQWRWSSFQSVCSSSEPVWLATDRLLAHFGGHASGRNHYADLCNLKRA